MKKMLIPILYIMTILQATAQENYNMVFRSHTEFPGQTLANICGFAQDGKEYALLGASKGMIIMDVSNPATPTQIAQLPGPDNLWKEIKVYEHYAYVTSEGGQGLQVVDLSKLPNATVPNHFYTGDGAIAGQLQKIHALHIDLKKGVVYCYGTTGLANGGAVMLDIKTDPWNPKYLGMVSKDYIHDGFVENDTLYASHIYRGDMEIWYTGNKAAPVSLGSVKTPTAFTHNTWLSDNHKYAFTTDENNNSFLGAYDVSDPSNIHLVDKISHNIGSGAIVHNTHILNDYAISSYYTEGVTIHDVHRPDNLVEVAHYDTYAPPVNPSSPFEGAWGVYPFLPSGNLIISNIDEGLFIVSPTYKRACYLEGFIKDKTSKAAISGATIVIKDVSTANATSSLTGEYKTGVANAGEILVTVSKPGYKSKTVSATVANGEVTNLDIELESLVLYTLTVQVVDENNVPLKDVKVVVNSVSQNTAATTNTNGIAVISSFVDTFSVYVGKWGYNMTVLSKYAFEKNDQKKFILKKGYKDDFVTALPFGWTTNATASAGLWVMGAPIETTFNGDKVTPNADATDDIGNECFLTGNESGQPGSSDVDNGYVILTSPTMDLTAFAKPTLRFRQWFYNGGGNGTPPNDSMVVIINNGQVQKNIRVAKGTGLNKWNTITIPLNNTIPLTANTTISFKAVDEPEGHLVKAAVDVFEVYDNNNIAVSDIFDESLKLEAYPNPSRNAFTLNYDKNAVSGTVIITNIQGQVIAKYDITANQTMLEVGTQWESGIYFAQIQSEGKVGKAIKLVKVN